MHQNFFLLCTGHMGINLCRTDGAVSKHPLYVPDIHILLQQESSERVTEHMWRYVLVDAG